ncbi:MAG TPA: MBL fold metallo-hydrolase [Alicyclobacillus sp.]|nr:MBL fold metallo-hydrolase [Alicyclobacillus sp.]
MRPSIEVLFQGFPGKTDRGFLGWSSCVLLRGEHTGLFDTAGFAERQELVHRLKRRGLSPEHIDYVVLSHFHFDHAANVLLFSKATIYLHELELQHVRESGRIDYAVPWEMFETVSRTGRLQTLKGASGTLPEGLAWMHTPGHTPGSITLVVDSPRGRFALAADAIKNRDEARTGNVWMSVDPAASRESIARILDTADWVVPGHDGILRVNHVPNGREVHATERTRGIIDLILTEVDSQIHVTNSDGQQIKGMSPVYFEIKGDPS